MSALAAYEAGLRTGSCWVRSADGSATPLPVGRWLADADVADHQLLAACTGPTLDVGCGPGRLTVALAERSVPALGIDVAPEAVRMTRARGGDALRRDVFGTVPGQGRWSHVLLADGNIGIGGDPVGLLCRVRELLRPSGTALVDLHRPGAGLCRTRLHLAAAGVAGGEFPWASVGTDAVGSVAQEAGLAVSRVFDVAGRWVAELAHPAARVRTSGRT